MNIYVRSCCKRICCLPCRNNAAMNFTGSLSHCFSFTGKCLLDSAKESFMCIQVSLTCLVDCKPNYTSRTSYFSHQTKMPEQGRQFNTRAALSISCWLFERRNWLQYFYRTRVRSLFTLVSNSLTHWLTDSCLVNLIDVTLACEDANSKLVDVVTVTVTVTVADEDRVGNNLL